MLEILSEIGKKDEISDRSLMKAHENLTNIIGPLDRLWEHLDHLKKDNERIIDLNMLLELVEQCVILVGQCHSRGSYFRRQAVLTALFRDRHQVKLLLKARRELIVLRRSRKSFLGKGFKRRSMKLSNQK